MFLEGLSGEDVEVYCIGLIKGGVHMLNFNIRGENIEVTPAIREHVEKKLQKLERYFNEQCERNCKCQYESLQ